MNKKDMDILIDKDDGKMRFVSLAPEAILDSAEVPARHLDRQALEIGREVMDALEDGQRVNRELGVDNEGTYLRVYATFEPVEPPELVGLEFLKGQKGKMLKAAWSESLLCVGEDGITWAGDANNAALFVSWDTIKDNEMILGRDASAKNCPVWHEEKNDDTEDGT